ncbi:hypothetical protein HMPREF1612_02813 [Escherichia coli 908585]|nr:hypothetical protein HMPREF1612_02813 [Escherichia coli 908585]
MFIVFSNILCRVSQCCHDECGDFSAGKGRNSFMRKVNFPKQSVFFSDSL